MVEWMLRYDPVAAHGIMLPLPECQLFHVVVGIIRYKCVHDVDVAALSRLQGLERRFVLPQLVVNPPPQVGAIRIYKDEQRPILQGVR